MTNPETITAPKLDSQEAHLLTLALNILDWDKTDLEQYLFTQFKSSDLTSLSYATLEDLFSKLHGLVIASVPIGDSHKKYWQAFNAIYHPYREIAINKFEQPDDALEETEWVEPMEPWQWYHAA